MRLILFISFWLPTIAFSQISNDVKFLDFLVRNGKYSDAFTFFQSNPNFKNNDTLSFNNAKALFYNKEFFVAEKEFGQLKTSNFGREAQYYMLLSRLYRNSINDTLNLIFHELPDESLAELFQYGVSTLKQEKFDNSNLLNDGNYLIKNHASNLNGVNNKIDNQKSKSPLLAASMSAVIPGTGKMYSGKIGEGVASFFITGILLAGTIEQYLNGGFNNPQFYLLGIPCSFFYFGGIYGSYFSVNVRNYEFEETIRNEVLFNLHIPFKSIYNQ